MGRYLRRVPLDFDWTPGVVWPGCIPDRCPACGGSGLSPFARNLDDTFHIDGVVLDQEDLNYLAARGRWYGDAPTGKRARLDAVSIFALVGFRCAEAGQPLTCATCDGTAGIDGWEPEFPPAGDGWQVWDDTTEGMPVSRVFATEQEAEAWRRAYDCPTRP